MEEARSLANEAEDLESRGEWGKARAQHKEAARLFRLGKKSCSCVGCTGEEGD
jgi:hypothetical protein